MTRRRAWWFHGRSGNDGCWQTDRAHPGVWLASTRLAATWYASGGGSVVTAELRPASVLDLNDPDTFNSLLKRTSLSHRRSEIRRVHASGNLYLLDEGTVQNMLVAEAFRRHSGLVMRDRTDGHSHLSLVVQNPEVLRACSVQTIPHFECSRIAKRHARQL